MLPARWKSKLGNEYDHGMIERYNNEKGMLEIDRLRRLPRNKQCADCGNIPTQWASVNLGVFLCIRCGSHHRGIGTHISKPKGCTGTYLWGPDEVERMRAMGNIRADQIYGGNEYRPSVNASDAEWRQFLVDKYEHKRFVPAENSAMQSMPPRVSASPPEQADLMTFGETTPSNSLPSQHETADFFSEFGL